MLDRRAARRPLAEAVRAAVAGGVDWVQVRERELEGAALLAHADEILRAARDARRDVRVLVNRRVDVALAIGADGVHLGFDAMPVAAARALLREWGERADDALVGVSCHAPAEVADAAAAGASYAHLAPVFAPLSKPAGRPALGPDALAGAARAGIPVLAQGGVEAANAGRLVRAGAAGVAVTGAVLGADDPGAAAAALRRALDDAALPG